MATMKRLWQAAKDGDVWCVLPANTNHPFPDIGARLYQHITKKNGEKEWVCVLMGHQKALQSLATKYNKEEHKLKRAKLEIKSIIPLLKEFPPLH